MGASVLDRFPLRLLIDGEDVSQLIDNGITFSNVDPGGYEGATVAVPKDMPTTLVGQSVRLECGLATVWEGRIAEVQRSLGARTTLTCEGYGAILKENTTRVVFVDRDLSSWQGPSVQRQLSQATTISMTAPTTEPDITTGQPSLLLRISDNWAATPIPFADGWYDAQGVQLGSIYYAWKINANISPSDTNWSWIVALDTDDVGTIQDATSELRAAGPGSGTLSAGGSGRVFAHVRLAYNVGPAGGAGTNYDLRFTCLAVYGNHGLTKRGSNSATDAQGFYAGDVAGWVETQLAALNAGIITDATGYVIPHLVYKTPATYEQIVSDVAKFIGCHWGVWESLNPIYDARPRLDFRPYPTRPTAWCQRSDCSQLDVNEQLAQLYDTAVVTYTDPATGRSNALTVTSANPLLVAAGMSGRTIVLDGGTMTAARARDFGALSLTLLLLQARVAGNATIIDTISTNAGEAPAFVLKSGLDRLRVTDLPGVDVVGTYSNLPIKRVETTLANDSVETNVEIGTGANLIETLQARLAEVASVLGF